MSISMEFGRRALLGGLAGGAVLGALGGARAIAPPPPVIPLAERAARIDKAQRLMRKAGLSALLVESGSTLDYFTGVQWHRSERLTAAVIPAAGKIGLVTPAFEAPSILQMLQADAELRVWNEDEDPLAVVAGLLRDRKAAAGPIGIEETVRYFAVDGLARVLPHAAIRSGAAVVRGCRMVKSETELALMQRATDITIAAYRQVVPTIREGQTREEIAKAMDAATVALGGSPEFSLVLVGEASAYPHGSNAPQIVRDGSVVLMDCGCSWAGYQSDVSRTLVFGKASDEVRQVWEQVAEGQRIAFAAARIGAPAGSVDDAVRARYQAWGYGPGYKLPGLSHRTGHGIGLDGHEPVNLVHGEATPLAAGMCFSDEPGLYLPGRFGVRLEDCFHMTEAGPRWFSEPPASIDKPV